MNNKLDTEKVLFNSIRMITVVCQNSILTFQVTMHLFTRCGIKLKTVAINKKSFELNYWTNKSGYDFYDKKWRFQFLGCRLTNTIRFTILSSHSLGYNYSAVFGFRKMYEEDGNVTEALRLAYPAHQSVFIRFFTYENSSFLLQHKSRSDIGIGTIKHK